MTDKEIIRMFQERNQSAIFEVKKKYSAYCNGIAYNILKNREDAEECENDTYLAAWNSIPPADPKNLTAFLAKITRNISLSKLKIRKAKKRIPQNEVFPIDELYSSLSDSTGVESEIHEKELGEIIDSFLRTLKESERKLFIRRYWFSEEISHIAKDFGFTESKVKMSLLRTRNKLREYLTEKGVQI